MPHHFNAYSFLFYQGFLAEFSRAPTGLDDRRGFEQYGARACCGASDLNDTQGVDGLPVLHYLNFPVGESRESLGVVDGQERLCCESFKRPVTDAKMNKISLGYGNCSSA